MLSRSIALLAKNNFYRFLEFTLRYCGGHLNFICVIKNKFVFGKQVLSYEIVDAVEDYLASRV